MTVLIVDDHPSFRGSARALLEAEGYEVVGEAENGARRADRGAGAAAPDIVLLDVQLPDIDGFEVASRLTKDDDAPAVVLISSRDGSDFGHLVRDSGARGLHPEGRVERRRDRRAAGVSTRSPRRASGTSRCSWRAGSAALVFTSDHESSPWATAALATATASAFVAAGLIAWGAPARRTARGSCSRSSASRGSSARSRQANDPLVRTRSASRSTACRSSSSPGSCWPIRRAGSRRARPRARRRSTAGIALVAQPAFYLVDDEAEMCADCPDERASSSRGRRRSRNCARDRPARARRRVVVAVVADPRSAAGCAPRRRCAGHSRRSSPPRSSRRRARGAARRELVVDESHEAFDWLLLASLLARPARLPLRAPADAARARRGRPAAARGARGGRARAVRGRPAPDARRPDAEARALGRPRAATTSTSRASTSSWPTTRTSGSRPASSTRAGRSPRCATTRPSCASRSCSTRWSPPLGSGWRRIAACAPSGGSRPGSARSSTRSPTSCSAIARDGTYLDFKARTPTATSSTPPEQVVGRTVRERLPAGLADLIMAAIERALETGEGVQTIEYELDDPRRAALLRGPRRGRRRPTRRS